MTRYTLYIPTEALTPAVGELVDDLTPLFGGCTRTKGTGTWLNEAGLLQTEHVYIFTYLAPTPWHDLQYRVRQIERSITDMSGEDCILSTNEQTNLSFTLKLPKGG